MSNGFFSVQGSQLATPGGGRIGLGPFNINFSAVNNIIETTVNTQVTIAVPSASSGVWVTPPIGNLSPTLTWSSVSYANATNNYIAPGEPSYWDFDAAHVPANLYLVSGGSVVVTVQFV